MARATSTLPRSGKVAMTSVAYPVRANGRIIGVAGLDITLANLSQRLAAMKPLGDAFIALVRMIIAPVIFLTVVTGIAGMENMKELGRVGFRALIYFEVVSTLALVVGLDAADLVLRRQFGLELGLRLDGAGLGPAGRTGFASFEQTHPCGLPVRLIEHSPPGNRR